MNHRNADKGGENAETNITGGLGRDRNSRTGIGTGVTYWLTGALTGPPSSTYAPAVEAMRTYIDRVNAAGGINSRKIKLVIGGRWGPTFQGRGKYQKTDHAGQR